MIFPSNYFDILFSIIILLLGIRTLFWHLQNWQLREYRIDRMKSHFRTKDGFISILNLWFFNGILPRPKFTGRIFMIIGIFLLLFFSFTVFLFYKSILYYSISNPPLKPSIVFPLYFFFAFFVLSERLIWLFVFISVFISKLPVFISREILFLKAKKIRESAKNLTVIGLAGSYGKSSTKEILVHLLNQEFGKRNVLFNPENKNNEVAIARLILNNKQFFQEKKKRFLVIEVGAYHRGEIAKVCNFIQPQISIITGLNAQHIELFGSQKNIQKAKFEMAENTNKKVFFNRDNKLLSEIFEDNNIKATKIGLSETIIENIKSYPNKTTFKLYGENFTLPWPGEFFVSNALLALECARECGINRTKLPNLLKTIPPLDRALKTEKFKNGTIFYDLYSANPNGVISAIKHLAQFKGKKIFISIPLRELGNKSEKVHKKIFQELFKIKAQVFWCKNDFSYLGKNICGKNFHQISKTNTSSLKKIIKTIEKNDAILCESKLPKFVLNLF